MTNKHELTELEAYRIQAAIGDAIYGTDRITPEIFNRVGTAAIAVRQTLDAMGIAFYANDPEDAIVPVVEYARFGHYRK